MIKSPTNTSKCFNCGSVGKHKKLTRCQGCDELHCNNHIKINDEEYSSMCLQCLKKRVHLEVCMEMEKEILDHKTELVTTKSKVKSAHQELKELEERINSLKIKSETRKNMQKDLASKLEMQIKSVNSSLACDEHSWVMEKLESERRKNRCEKGKLLSLEESYKNRSEEKEKITREVQECKMIIKKMDENIQEMILYSAIRTLVCIPCKKIIKKKFSEDISKGYSEDSSVMESLRQKNSMISVKKSILRESKKENCSCLIV